VAVVLASAPVAGVLVAVAAAEGVAAVEADGGPTSP